MFHWVLKMVCQLSSLYWTTRALGREFGPLLLNQRIGTSKRIESSDHSPNDSAHAPRRTSTPDPHFVSSSCSFRDFLIKIKLTVVTKADNYGSVHKYAEKCCPQEVIPFFHDSAQHRQQSAARRMEANILRPLYG